MNVILERTSQVSFFTNMRTVFEALGIRPSSFDWFISDVETNDFGNQVFGVDQWVTGQALEDYLASKDVQFVWGVFSAVSKGTRLPIEDAPFVDGNPDYWQGRQIGPQLDGALFEISCWDSSATILVGLPDENIENFMQTFSDAKPLESIGDSRSI